VTKLADYQSKYKHIKFRREHGVLEMRFHTNEGPLRWGLPPHAELPDAFTDVARDRENRAIVMTGTGDEFNGPRVIPGTINPVLNVRPSAQFTENLVSESKRLIMNLLDIEVPIVSAVNGPAWRHCEMPLLADIVIASDTALFSDSGHFPGGQVPGDGVHVVFPMLMGMNRGRYFLWTGQVIKADEALRLGLVNEVLPKDKVLERAWEHARHLAAQPEVLVRHTRNLLVEPIKRAMHEYLALGLYNECLALMDRPDAPK
jgi:enoyl-CoA hydratase/carnithine racemase